MIYSKRINSTKGFTLVELLIVMVIMGLVITSVYSLFINNNKTANTSEEVVDVQQNVRVAMETLVADIRMAGFLVDGTAISTAPATFGLDENGDGDFDDAEDSNTLFTFRTRSSTKTYARVLGEDTTFPAGIIVETEMASQFSVGSLIHIIRPTTNQDIAGPWTVGTPAGNKLPITGYTAGLIESGDMVVRKIAGEAVGATTISYWLRKNADDGDNIYNLVRDDGSTIGAQIIASNISLLDLMYIMADGTEVNTTTNFDQIKAIRINISGQTDNTKTGLANYSGVKTRSLQTVVKIQNAFGG